MERPKLGELLIEAGLLDAGSLQRALAQQQRWGGPLGRYLVEMGLIDENDLIRTLAEQLQLPSVALDPERMDPTVVASIPQQICDRFGVIAFSIDASRRFVDVAMADATNLDALDAIRVATRLNVRPYIAGPKQVERAIDYFFHGMAPKPATRQAAAAPPRGAVKTPPPQAAPVEDEVLPTQVVQAAAAGAMPGVTAPAQGPVRPTAPRPEYATAAQVRELLDRLGSLEQTVSRMETILQSVIAVLVDRRSINREELARRVAERFKGKRPD